MKRISIFIREDQKNKLNKISKDKNISYSEIIRDAIDTKLYDNFITSDEDITKKTFGILKDRFDSDRKSEDIISSLRKDWDRNKENKE